MRVRPALACLAAALLPGCASVNYDATRAGSFDGELVVVWLAGTNGPGDGTFVYVPSPSKPLTFTRPKGKTVAQVLRPQMMYTDGGSVPSIGRAFRGLTPWNYGPAYMVHDWLFTVRQCLNDHRTDPAYAALDQVTFQDSAEIIAESIRALHDSGRVRPDDVSGAIVTAAVSSPLSRQRWDIRGACREVTPDDRDMALRAIGAQPAVGDIAGAVMVPNGLNMRVREPAAKVVAIYSF